MGIPPRAGHCAEAGLKNLPIFGSPAKQAAPSGQPVSLCAGACRAVRPRRSCQKGADRGARRNHKRLLCGSGKRCSAGRRLRGAGRDDAQRYLGWRGLKSSAHLGEKDTKANEKKDAKAEKKGFKDEKKDAKDEKKDAKDEKKDSKDEKQEKKDK